MKIGFVIPVYKDDTVGDTVRSLKAKFKDCIVVVVSDDDKSSDIAREAGAFVPYHCERIGYGMSLIEGMKLAYYTLMCDIVITMDNDHPINIVEELLKKAESTSADVVVGHEIGDWKIGKTVGNALVIRCLGFSRIVSNPTCGLVAWKKDILYKIPWRKIRCRWDAIHFELLYSAKEVGAEFENYLFPDHGGARRYGIIRWLDWWFTFLRIL